MQSELKLCAHETQCAKHTDTSPSSDLVERLGQAKNNHVLCCQAIARINADGRRIKALEAKVERLREVLKATHNLAAAYAAGTGTLFDEAMAEARAELERIADE